MRLSKRIAGIEGSITIALSERAKELKSKGIDIISLTAGEPDFDTPDYIKEAALAALRKGLTKYTSGHGVMPLREAVCKKLKRDNNLDYTPQEVAIACGAKHAIYNLFHVLLDQGDQVIIPSPYWTSYPEMTKVAGGVPVIVETSEANGFKITPDQIERAITPRSRVLMLNSPNNPTGSVYSKAELGKLAEIIVEKELAVLSDEIYEKFIYDGEPHTSIASLNPKIKALTATVNSVSKTYAMTGWRIGYVAGPKDLIDGVAKLQSQQLTNPTTMAQYASINALVDDQSSVAQMASEYKKRRDLVTSTFSRNPRLKFVRPDGAFYVFLDVSNYLSGTTSTPAQLCEFLLEKVQVALVPGEAFGSKRHVRISYATETVELKRGIDRLMGFFN